MSHNNEENSSSSNNSNHQLESLKYLYDAGVLTEDEYIQKRDQIIDELMYIANDQESQDATMDPYVKGEMESRVENHKGNMYKLLDVYDKSKIGMIKGVGAILAGFIISGISVTMAKANGGSFYVMYGLVIYGFITLVKSLYVFVRCWLLFRKI